MKIFIGMAQINQKYIKMGLNLIFITLMAYFGVKTFYSFFEAGPRPLKSPAKGSQSKSLDEIADKAGKKSEPFDSYAGVAKRNLFKSESKTEKEKKLDVSNLKETGLNLKLWGTIQSSDGDSYAVIEDSSKKDQQLYKPGDRINNSTLKMVLREKVVLTVDGVDEVLQMEKSDKGQAASRNGHSGFSGRSRGDEKEIPIARREVEAAMGDVNNLMRQISLKPHISDGKPDGISVSSVQPNSIFKKAGLQSGDVIISIDGREIKTFEDVMGMYESMKSATRIEMQVKRQDTPVTLVYNLGD